MTDEEIAARLPTRLHPYLAEKLARRLLRPVELGSPEFHFAMSLLYVASERPEMYETRWPEIASQEATLVDPVFVRRCHRVLNHVRTNLERRTALLLKRLGQVSEVLHSTEDDVQ